MVAINFQKKFAPEVESGKKLMTIRRTARIKKGDKLQLYTGQRTVSCRKLRDAICIAVDSVNLTPAGPFFGNPGWWPKDKHEFAAMDGFKSYGDMLEFFHHQYGYEVDYGEFKGYIIMWNEKEADHG